MPVKIDLVSTLRLHSRNEQLAAPDCVYLEGRAELLSHKRPRVAIVGSREASVTGLERARVFAKALASKGVVVVSGLAAGIDRAAHDGALEADGDTIAVLGTPLSRAYPAQHAAFQAHLARTQLVVSQFAEGARTSPQDFVARNTTMALIAQASVVVEASDASGTLTHAVSALRLGRQVFFLRDAAKNPRLTWPAKLAAKGAHPIASPDEVLAVVRRLVRVSLG